MDGNRQATINGHENKMPHVNVNSDSGLRRMQELRLVENTSRVLNITALEKSFLTHETNASPSPFVQSGLHPSRERFFFNESLNRAIFVKHNVSADERRLFNTRRPVETKVLLPFDSGRLGLGGRSFFIGERNYKEILRNYLNINPDAPDKRTTTDLKVLEVFRKIPSFDPFILSEALRGAGINVDRRYFNAGYDTMQTAAEAVYLDVKPLIEAALGKQASREELARFVDEVWNVTESSTTNVFFETLRIPPSEWQDTVFAWKALHYYRMKAQKTDEPLFDLISAMKTVRLSNNVNGCGNKDLNRLKHHLVDGLFRLHKRAATSSEILSQELVTAISGDLGLSNIREILRKLSLNIVALGTDVTVFEQVISYYMHLFGEKDCFVDGMLYETTVRSLDEIVVFQFSGQPQAKASLTSSLSV